MCLSVQAYHCFVLDLSGANLLTHRDSWYSKI